MKKTFKMLNLSVNRAISDLLGYVEDLRSSPLVRWMLRLLALSQAVTPAGWPEHYRLHGKFMAHKLDFDSTGNRQRIINTYKKSAVGLF